MKWEMEKMLVTSIHSLAYNVFFYSQSKFHFFVMFVYSVPIDKSFISFQIWKHLQTTISMLFK